MTEQTENGAQEAGERTLEQGLLWPSPTYSCQVEVLKSAIGQKVYLVELRPDNINLGIHLSDTAFELLAVLDFPRPDPSISLAPHLVLLDDGRGINLGRIARISIDTPFNPPVEHLLYEDNFLMEKLLRRKRQLSHEFTEVRSKLLLGKLLGKVAKMERNCLKNESA